MASPSLADLDAFVAVARARGFRGAAAARGGSASGLSEAVRRLEAALGVRLLNRTTRSVTPTEAGQRLLERLAPALGEIESGLDVVNGFRSSPRGTLKLNVPVIVAMKVLPPIATRFLAAHPGVTLEVAANDDLIDMVRDGFDAGVRYEERIERDMIAVPIGPRVQRFITAAAPSYLAAHGAPAHPRDLVNHACLRHRFPRGVVSDWQFERGDETVQVRVDGPLIASAIDLQLSARRSRDWASSAPSRSSCARRSIAANLPRCSPTGGRSSPGRSSIIRAATCRRLCGRSSILCARMGRRGKRDRRRRRSLQCYARRHRLARKSRIISRAALKPGAPVTPPPGWVEAPHMYKPGTGER